MFSRTHVLVGALCAAALCAAPSALARPASKPAKRHRTHALSPRAMIARLRFDYTTAQLDTLYRSLPAGPMPGWNVSSWGRVRCEFDVHCAGFDQNQAGNTAVNDPFVPLLWNGQTWYTTRNGGYFWNRTLNRSTDSLPAEVRYGASPFDGKRAIIGTYPFLMGNPPPVQNLVLECRTVQRKVLTCDAWEYAVAPYVGPKVLLFYVFQDFNNPN